MTEKNHATIAEKLWVIGLSKIKRYVPKDGQDFPEMIHRTDDFVHVRRVMYLGEFLVNVLQLDQSHLYKPDLRKVQDMGYHHDDPEIATKDIIATEKHKMSQEKQKEFEKEEDLAAYAVAHFIFGLKHPFDQIYADRQKEYREKLTLESQIVDVADKWDAACEILHEARCGNKEFSQLITFSKQTFDNFSINYPFYKILDSFLEFSKIPAPREISKLPTIDINDLKKPGDVAEFMSSEKTKDWPTCYKTWANLNRTIFNLNPEKFLFPGWYLQLWTKWNSFKKGTTTSSGLIIP